jgi:uncharacterized protein (TIGR00369 family)
VCGREADGGFRARLRHEDGEVLANVEIPRRFQGYPATAHGGVVSALLDEVLCWAVMAATGRLCVTREMRLRYLRPVPTETPLLARARVPNARGRGRLRSEARLEGPGGETLAEAEATFAPALRAERHRLDAFLVYDPGALRIFDRGGE